jgi:sulfide:quinone oxidoreductase
VAICGGGVAALEALLALRDLLAIRPHVDLIAPNPRFIYKPMAVAEPFGMARTELFDLAEVAGKLEAELHVGSLAAVEHDRRELVLDEGERVSYDAALIAVGGRRVPWLEGACCFGADRGNGSFADVLERLESGASSSLAFVCPPDTSWTLPLYELALLTASRLAEQGIADVRLSLITPERSPLALFGRGVAQMVRDLLADRGIALLAHERARMLANAGLVLASGRTLEVDEVVTLARVEGPHVPGLPDDGHGFIPVDECCRVAGLDGVYAVGDCCTASEVKQGGLAAQQADVAAEAIAAGLGAAIEPTPFEPVLRAMIFTGIAPIYLRARLHGTTVELAEVETAGSALWSPATKIAGRQLAPFLARVPAFEHAHLEEHPPSELDTAAVGRAREESRELALLFAEADARSGDFSSALSWLAVVERLDGTLPAGYADKQAGWRAANGVAG